MSFGPLVSQTQTRPRMN